MRVLLLALVIATPAGTAPASPAMCSYSTYTWNTVARRAVDIREVSKPYASLLAEEVDSTTRCSVCREDQVWIDIAGLPRFQVCRHVAREVSSALKTALSRGARIDTVEGYRVGRTRGEADASGNRTGFSNHSFGIAIDINPQSNGLYGNCLQFGASCSLLRGGPWEPGNPASLVADGPVVKAFKAAGFKWGGEIAGRQKDFMHFSISGY